MDVVGCSCLMERDETGTRLAINEPAVERFAQQAHRGWNATRILHGCGSAAVRGGYTEFDFMLGRHGANGDAF